MTHKRKQIWNCDCGGAHYIEIELWKDIGYLVLQDYTEPRTWKERLQDVWAALKGRKHGWTAILLTAEIAREIAQALVEGADRSESPDESVEGSHELPEHSRP